MPDDLGNLDVRSCKLSSGCDTFGISWMDDMHVESFDCLIF